MADHDGADAHTLMTIAAAVQEFVSQPRMAPGTRVVYESTLNRLVHALPSEIPVRAVTRRVLEDFLVDRHHFSAVATWNANVSAFRSFFGWCTARGILE